MRRALLALALLVAGPAAAGDVRDVPPLARDVRQVPVGAWARYRTSWATGGGVLDVTVALIARGPDRAVWELSAPGVGGADLVTRVEARLVDGAPVAETGRWVRAGAAPARRVPRAPDAPDAPPPFVVPAPGARATGAARLAVAAGTFQARHVVDASDPGHGFDFWIAPAVAATGVVRFEEWTRGGNGVRLVQRTWELIAQGRGARATFAPTDQPLGKGDLSRALGLPTRGGRR